MCLCHIVVPQVTLDLRDVRVNKLYREFCSSIGKEVQAGIQKLFLCETKIAGLLFPEAQRHFSSGVPIEIVSSLNIAEWACDFYKGIHCHLKGNLQAHGSHSKHHTVS
jgi:hypothetical protein